MLARYKCCGNIKRMVKLFESLLIPILIIITKPMGINTNQSIVLGSLILTVIWWSSGIVSRDFSSIFLLASFVVFGDTPLKEVFNFPLSNNFILIVSSFLLSQGIANSKVADRFSEFFLARYCDSALKLVLMSFILGIIMIFIIPQPFPRTILLSSIYIKFISDKNLSLESREVVMFSVFAASACTSMLFINGDITLNSAAIKFGNINMPYLEWIRYMTAPTLAVIFLTALIFIFTFRKEIMGKSFKVEENKHLKLDYNGKVALCITSFIILLWLTENLHKINASGVAVLGVVAMFATKIITIKDLKTINLSLLLFMTAQYSIGKVMTGSGAAYRLSDYLMEFFPRSGSIFYLPFIVILVMMLHMIMGSLITSLSVIIPTLIYMISGNLPPEIIVFITYVTVSMHFLLPFHSVTIMIGFGNNYYRNKHTLRLGIGLTILTFISTMFIYIPWWKLIGKL